MKILKTLAAAALMISVTLALAPTAAAQSKHKVLHWFYETDYQHVDGTAPYGSLVVDAAGSLYGTTTYGWGSDCYWVGCGSVFKLTPNPNGGWKETVLSDVFFDTDYGSWPYAGVIFDAAGNLYGVAAGDYSCCGIVFEGKPNSDGSWTWTTLYRFTGGTDGATPRGRLVLDSAGNLYGTSVNGGTYGYGVVFKLAPNLDGSWTESVLHIFTGGADGANPISGLTFDTAGNLYGATVAGGFAGCGGPGCGTVYKLTPSGNDWKQTVVRRFTGGKDGSKPEADVTFDGTGNLYVTNANGGAYGQGTVFELIPKQGGGWTGKVLHQFKGGKDGSNPYGGVVLDASGNVYGTTYNGGAWNFGIVFELTPGTDGKWTERLLQTFNGKPDLRPYASLVLDGAGNLYGTTVEGHQGCGYWTSDCGSVFEITP